MDGPGRVDGWYTATSLADIIVQCAAGYWKEISLSGAILKEAMERLYVLCHHQASVDHDRDHGGGCVEEKGKMKNSGQYKYIDQAHEKVHLDKGAGAGSDSTIRFKINRSQTW